MTKLSTAAWVAHNLGLAACFGGLLFGKTALNPSLNAIDSQADRGKVRTPPGIATTLSTWPRSQRRPQRGSPAGLGSRARR
jgi:hypothetical protein